MFAYAIGLIASDGCLYRDGRHIAFVSKDREQINNFKKALSIKSKISKTKSGYGAYVFRVQLSNSQLFDFLMSIGITPSKSRTIKEVQVPTKYFWDFARGLFDGDGSVHSYFDKRWRSSYMVYTSFASASKNFLIWLQEQMKRDGLCGFLTSDKNGRCFQLKFAKKESIKIFDLLYKNKATLYLSRKKLKIQRILGMIDQHCKSA